MLLTDFCNRLATCAPRRTGRFPRWRPRFHAVTTFDGAYAPANDPGRDAFDDAPRAGSSTLRAPADPAGADATRSCRAPDRSAGPQVASLVPWRCLPRRSRACRPLTPPSRRAQACRPVTHRRDRLPRPLVKGDGSERPRAPSIDELPARPPHFRTAPSNADPPPIPGLRRPGPASGALSPLAPEGGGARPCRFRTLFAPGRSWPRAARRLLQPKRSASTTADLETRL
jgi:hypothetical protein